jgi:fused signal recognition particle receptor
MSVPRDPADGWLARFGAGLKRTREGLLGNLGGTLGTQRLTESDLEELETALILSDAGVESAVHITGQLRQEGLKPGEDARNGLQRLVAAALEPAADPLVIRRDARPFVILVVGVNGVGKTTTIGKLARRFLNDGLSVMLAAGDTFRAAAVEQLQVWGERNGVPVIAQGTNSDPAAVIHDAVAAAQARQADVLIADTAGRLHNKAHLMEELKKVARVCGRLHPGAPHEVLLVLDAGAGQNSLAQLEQFKEAAGVTGLALTKLDGTAKGGILLAIARQHRVPVRYLGLGEGVDDLREFDSEAFAAALCGAST